MSSFQPGDEGIIDVERRTKQAEYTLGDPTVFPVEFLTWIKRYIEQSGITLPNSSIIGSAAAGSLASFPPGMIFPYAVATAPAGSLPCDGASKLRTDFPLLFGVIGTTWGAADGTHFNVPDLRDRTLFGGGAGATLIVGQAAGRGAAHKHTTGIAGGSSPTGKVLAQDASNALGGSGAGNLGQALNFTVGPPGAGATDAPGYAVILYAITAGA